MAYSLLGPYKGLFLKQANFARWVYEPEAAKIIKSLVKPGWVCADVGAHLGIFTLLLAKLVGPKGKVVAFEAFPRNIKSLKENIKLNHYQSRVKVENIAISDGLQSEVWLFPGRHLADGEWNIVGHDVEGKKTKPQLRVESISLDDYFTGARRLDFVKIDVEGAEKLALRGMRRILRQLRPLLLIEFHDEVGWSGRKELFSAGYDLYNLEGKKLNPKKDSRRVYHCLACPWRKHAGADR